MPTNIINGEVTKHKQNFFPSASYLPEKHANKARGSYSRTVKNKDPRYEVPKSYINVPPLIKDMVRKSQSMDVTISDVAMYSRITGERKKRFYSDRNKAINALFCVFCQHLNLVTHQVEISLRNASDSVGLSTISDNELNKVQKDPFYIPQVSISRASRAFKDMIKLGWIWAPEHLQVWDKESGHWLEKYFEVTPLFFAALGITSERVEKSRTQRLEFLRKRSIEGGMTSEAAGRMSITSLKAERRLAWRKKAMSRKRKEQNRKKVLRELKGKNRKEQRAVATNNVINALCDDIHNITTEQFSDLINKEIASLRKFSNLKPPLH